MTPSEAAQKYHWVKYNPVTNTVELYMDNFMLSTLRMCEGKFKEEHLDHIYPKKVVESGVHDLGPWFFTYGEYVHWCLEQFYDSFKKFKTAPEIAAWIDQCKVKWDQMGMDKYATAKYPADVKKYEEVKGWQGVAGMLMEYYAFYMDMRLRVVDTEITFGHNKEVKIGEFPFFYDFDIDEFKTPITNRVYRSEYYYKELNIQCYLTGRIDLLVDNGYKVGPVDHKTTHRFDGWEHLDFNPHDGITGYVLAIREILKRYKDAGLTSVPMCTGGWIYHLSACRPSEPNAKSQAKGKTKAYPRFKVTPIDKTDIALEDYKRRQLTTFKRVAALLFNNEEPQWDTTLCNNFFHRICPYKAIHEQPSNEQGYIRQQFYQIGKPWDTRDHSNKDDAKT